MKRSTPDSGSPPGLEIPPPAEQGSHRRKTCSFGTQYPWSKPQAKKSGAFQNAKFALIQTTLRANGYTYLRRCIGKIRRSGLCIFAQAQL
jgi:hypothetical protein